MTQLGMYSVIMSRTMQPSPAAMEPGTTHIAISEAYGGYHWNAMHGINIDAGMFLSYIGLFSYYNFDNWAYQPSYVSSNTPLVFQRRPSANTLPYCPLEIEPWFVNGWQSYNR